MLRTNSVTLNALDEKIAEYVFFPLSHVLRESEKLPVRASELSLLCLEILLRRGWRSHVNPALSLQLLILLAFMAGGRLKSQRRVEITEELQIAAFACLSTLFVCVSGSPKGWESLTDAANIPAIGHAVSVMLDGAAEGPSLEVQLSALTALQAFCSGLSDREALANLLPGIVSSLTRILTPSSSTRRSHKIAVLGFQVLSLVLQRVLNDEITRHLAEEAQTAIQGPSESKSPLNASWLTATAAQVKIAFANVIRLRVHDKLEVRRALFSLCALVLEECRNSLSASVPMMVETMVMIATAEDDTLSKNKLEALIGSAPPLAESLRSILHSWVTSLPWVMESSEVNTKQEAVRRISLAFRLLDDQDIDLRIIEQMIAANLRDSVAIVIKPTTNSKDISELDFRGATPGDSLVSSEGPQTRFSSVFTGSKSQQDMVASLQNLAQQMGETRSSRNLSKDLLHMVRTSNGGTRLSSFWLALHMFRSGLHSRLMVDNLVDLGSSFDSIDARLLDEIYSISLNILDEDRSDEDWRVQGLALEAIALQAEYRREAFQVDLVDALYPIIHVVGSSVPNLRRHAIVCLNVVAASCGYTSARDIIVSNVDYLVNAVALKLNTFNISPQAPQVLLMMVKLSGPSLLPYLDDVVSNIFAALEMFHGYPKLVQALFSVLKAIAEEGTGSPQLKLPSGSPSPHLKPALRALPVSAVMDHLTKLQRGFNHDIGDKDVIATSRSPLLQQPWKEDIGSSGQDLAAPENQTENEGAMPESKAHEAPVPPKSYDLLLRISRLTEHYLPSSSPLLRGDLLSLIHDAIPALAAYEDHFLPLINTLWPVLIARLDNKEAHIIAKTLDVIGELCVYAGDFMRGRIEDIWERMKTLAYSGKEKTASARSSMGIRPAVRITFNGLENDRAVTTVEEKTVSQESHYVETGTRLVWASLSGMMVKILEHVSVDEDVFDDMLELLQPVLTERADVMQALAARNPDAVWLVMLKLQRKDADDKRQNKAGVFGVAKPPSVGRWVFADLPD